MIRGARQLITMRAERGPRRGPALCDPGVIADGAVLIRDGRIEEVGPTRRVQNLAAARGAVEINAAGRVVLPGFVDCHTHLMFPSPGLPNGGEAAALGAIRTASGHRLQGRTQIYLEAMARHGTTTVEVKTGSLDPQCETKMLRVLGVLTGHPIEIAPSFLFRTPLEDASATTEWTVRDFLPKLRRRRFARFADVVWNGCPDHQPFFARYLEAARALGFPCRIHADHPDPARAIALALEHGVASIDHLEHATPAEAGAIAALPCIVTLLPYASFSAESSHAPGRALVDRGAAIAIGSNFSPQHSPTLNMQTVIALACRNLGLTPAEALAAATINAAYAVGCAGRLGSLEVGKAADLVILNLSDYREIANNFGMNLVHMTMKSGRFIYKEADVAGCLDSSSQDRDQFLSQ